jgi:uncharacterized protein YjcR
MSAGFCIFPQTLLENAIKRMRDELDRAIQMKREIIGSAQNPMLDRN